MKFLGNLFEEGHNGPVHYGFYPVQYGFYRSIMALKAIIDRQSILEQNIFLLYKYKPVCSIHNITYWLMSITTRVARYWLLPHVQIGTEYCHTYSSVLSITIC